MLLWLFAFHLGWEVRGIWTTLAILTNLQVLVMGVRLDCFMYMVIGLQQS